MIGMSVAQAWMADFSQVATGGLMAAVWQGVLLAALVGLGLRLLPKTPAAVRFAIWFAVFLLVAVLPMASLWPHAHGGTQMGGRGAWLTLDARWSVAVAAVWAVASLVRAGTLLVAAFRVRTLSNRARPVQWEGASGIPPTHRDIAAMNGAPGVLVEAPSGRTLSERARPVQWEGASGIHPTHCDSAAMNGAPEIAEESSWTFLGTRRAQICTSDEVDRPTVLGFFSPKILIPTWLLEKLTAAELEQIMLHETGHLGRADDWMNLLQKIALVVFPLNPALAWVERRLCFERELACDERVLRTTQAPKAYAACLATLAEHRLGRRGLALALGALGRESELGRRVGRILRRGETMRPLHAKLVLGGAMLGLLGGAVGLERCPQVIGFAADADQNAVVSARGSVRGGARYQAVVLREGERFDHELVQSRKTSRYARESIASVIGADETGPQRLKPLADGGGYGTAEAVPLSKTDVVERDAVAERRTVGVSKTGLVRSWSSDRAVLATVRIGSDEWNEAQMSSTAGRQDRRDGQTGDGAVELVVMTSWQGADGSQMVLTMASSSNVKERVVRQTVVSDTEPSAYEVYPYAAVPVRGGWLVFQL